MKRKTLLLLVALVVLLAAIGLYLDPSRRLLGLVRGETFFQDRPSSYWAAALTSRDPATQSEAIQKLTDAKTVGIPLLVELVESNPGADATSIGARTEALNLLGKVGESDQKAVDALIRSLQDADPNLRVVAAKGLGTAKVELPDSAIPILIEMLTGKEKVTPIRVLSKYGKRAEAAIPELRELLQDEDAEVRWNASRTLGKIGPASKVALPDLYPHFGDQNDQVREHAAETIGDIGPEAAAGIPYLEKALTDPYAKVRRDAVRSLGQLGAVAKGSLPKMLPLLDDKEELVREAARKAIRILDPNISVEGKK